jgi:hypothetical protein
MHLDFFEHVFYNDNTTNFQRTIQGVLVMAFLSRKDIERIAEPIIQQYKQTFVPEHHLCYCVDPVQLAAMLRYQIEYVHITKDGSILGQTSSNSIWTTVYDTNMNEFFFLLDGQTILIEKRLTTSPQHIGRKNFTIAHELAHQIINRLFPNAYEQQSRTFCDYRRSHKPVTDWYEWQADALAAALLLPPDAVRDGMFVCGLGEKMRLLSRKYSETNYHRFCDMANYLQVSRTALAYRMEQLGLLERNMLIQEAQKRKGVA